MDEREKIIEILKQTSDLWKDEEYHGYITSVDIGEIADALIAANIGDVTEWREKVECAKRILQIPTLPNGTTDLSYFEYKGERIQDIARQRDEYKHRAEVAEKDLERHKRALSCACYDKARAYCPNDDWREVAKKFEHDYLQQAEREIAKEEK